MIEPDFPRPLVLSAASSPAEQAAYAMYASWPGLIGQFGLPLALEKARRMRQDICQLSQRPIYSAGVSGDDDVGMRGMACAILETLRRHVEFSGKSPPPRGGICWLLSVHPSRGKAVLDDKRWPPNALPVRRHFARCVWWMFLGAGWPTHADQLAAHGRDRDRLRALGETDPARGPLWLARYAADVVEYFFPKATDEVPPYFSAARRTWSSSWDRQELTAGLRWVRRQHKDYNSGQRKTGRGCIYLWVSEPEAFEKLLGGGDRRSTDSGILRELTRAALQVPQRLDVKIFHPGFDECRIERFRDAMAGLVTRNALPAGAAGAGGHLPSDVALSSKITAIWQAEGNPSKRRPPPLRVITAFMLFGFVDQEDGLWQRFDHLYIVRPLYPPIDATPFSIRVSTAETKTFIASARQRWKIFDESYQEYVESNRADGLVAKGED